MYEILIWLLAVEVIGLCAFPITFLVFRRLPDRGYTLSKALGLLVFTYVWWLVGLTQFVTSSRLLLVLLVILFAAVATLLIKKHKDEIQRFVRSNLGIIVSSELIFLGFYFAWMVFAAHASQINHTEKPMDFAFMNAILRSNSFPPDDPWLAGHSISYYYFGHMMMAGITKLTAISSSISYNLSIVLIASLVAQGAYGVVYNLIKISGANVRTALVFALAAPIFIGLVSNLEGILEFVHAQGWGSDSFWNWIGIKGLNAPLQAASFYPNESWWGWAWRSTRIIDTVVDGRSLDYTITEFPFFSFILGDLHSHVMSLPFVLLNISIGLNLLLFPGRIVISWIKDNPWQVFVTSLSLGALGFINLIDLPVFGILLLILIFMKCYVASKNAWIAIRNVLVIGGIIIFVGVILYLPFYVTFSSQVSGILPVRDVATRPLHFFLVWGMFLFMGVSMLIMHILISRQYFRKDIFYLSLVFAISPFLLWASIDLFLSIYETGFTEGLISITGTFLRIVLGLCIVTGAFFGAFVWLKRGYSRDVVFVLVLLSIGVYLIIGPEMFRLVDIFNNRMNTVFKLYYQAWIMLGLVSAYALYYCVSRWNYEGISARFFSWGWIVVASILIVSSLYYAPGAALDKTKSQLPDSLDGLAFVKASSPGEYEAILWLRENLSEGNIVEAVGDDYSEFGRISASTGLPTILGWSGHEFQWRGSYTAIRGRSEDVEEIYVSSDIQRVQELLKKYNVTYVYVGPRESQRYSLLRTDKFEEFMTRVFQEDDVTIYEVY